MSKDKSFVDRILWLMRDHTGKNKKKFAELLGVGSDNIHTWINGGSFPSREHLGRFRDRLGVNLNWFYTGIGPPYLYDKPTNNRRGDKVSDLSSDYVVRFEVDEQKYVDKLLGVLRNNNEQNKGLIKSSLDIMKPDKPKEIKKGVKM